MYFCHTPRVLLNFQSKQKTHYRLVLATPSANYPDDKSPQTRRYVLQKNKTNSLGENFWEDIDAVQDSVQMTDEDVDFDSDSFVCFLIDQIDVFLNPPKVDSDGLG